MFKRVVVTVAIFAVLLTLMALSPAVLPDLQAAAQGGSNGQPAQAPAGQNNGAQQSYPVWIVVIGNDGKPQVIQATANAGPIYITPGPGGPTVQQGPAVASGNNGAPAVVNPDLALLPSTGNETAPAAPAANPFLANVTSTTPAIQALLNDMTFVWLQDEDYGRIVASCAGTGLRNVALPTNGSMVLIPNAGDLDVAGSTVAIKVYPNGQVEFIPRTQGQLIRVPVDMGTRTAGQEVLSLTFNEGLQLMATGQMTWTANNQGPTGNGYGLPGHIATCDPRYPGDDAWVDWQDNGKFDHSADNTNQSDEQDRNDNDNDNEDD